MDHFTALLFTVMLRLMVTWGTPYPPPPATPRPPCWWQQRNWGDRAATTPPLSVQHGYTLPSLPGLCALNEPSRSFALPLLGPSACWKHLLALKNLLTHQPKQASWSIGDIETQRSWLTGPSRDLVQALLNFAKVRCSSIPHFSVLWPCFLMIRCYEETSGLLWPGRCDKVSTN